MLSTGLAQNFFAAARGGMWWCTDYSGYDAVKDGLNKFVPRLSVLANEPEPPMKFVRGSDYGNLQALFLKERSEDEGGEACVFGDLALNMQVDAQEMLKNMVVKKARHLFPGLA